MIIILLFGTGYNFSPCPGHPVGLAAEANPATKFVAELARVATRLHIAILTEVAPGLGACSTFLGIGISRRNSGHSG